MFILFSLILMRMTGALVFHPVFSGSHYPARARAAMIFALSAVVYLWQGGGIVREPGTMWEYGAMLLWELFLGYALGFTLELSFMILRFAASVMDFSMGMNMAQVFDPSSSSQTTVSASLLYSFMILLFLSSDGALRFLSILFRSGQLLPFGTPGYVPALSSFLLEMFSDCIRLGLELAFPVLGMELMTEAALGILMRIIPQINIFSINVQVKICVGFLLLYFLMNPVTDRIYHFMELGFSSMEALLRLLS